MIISSRNQSIWAKVQLENYCRFWKTADLSHTFPPSAMAKRSSNAAFPNDVVEGRLVMPRVTDTCPLTCLQRGCTCPAPANELGLETSEAGSNGSDGVSSPWMIPAEDDWERSPFTFDWPRASEPDSPVAHPTLPRMPGTPPGPPPPSPLTRVPQTPPELLANWRMNRLPEPSQLVTGMQTYPGLSEEMTGLLVGFGVHLLPYLLDGMLSQRGLNNDGTYRNRRF